MSKNAYGESLTNRRATTAVESVNFVSSYIGDLNDEIESLIKKLESKADPVKNQVYKKTEDLLDKLSHFKDVFGKKRNELRREVSSNLQYIPFSLGSASDKLKATYASKQREWLTKKLVALEKLLKENESFLKSVDVDDNNVSEAIEEGLSGVSSTNQEDVDATYEEDEESTPEGVDDVEQSSKQNDDENNGSAIFVPDSEIQVLQPEDSSENSGWADEDEEIIGIIAVWEIPIEYPIQDSNEQNK